MKINQILDKIDENQLFVPAFQREYRWKKANAKELILSLIRDYPTGTMLTWETNNPPELKGEWQYTKEQGSVKLILDGQQRITTLYLLIRGTIPPYYTEKDIMYDPRGLYINVMTQDLQYYKKTVMDGNPLWVDVTDILQKKIRDRDIIRAQEDKEGSISREDEDTISNTINAVSMIKGAKNLTEQDIKKFMSDEFPNLQVFITTHSNHFLDLTYEYEDMKIYSFENKKEENKTLILDKTDNTKILDLLGVRNSSVFLANSVIWTEGVTDRMLIKALLDLDNFGFIEDRDYAFAEYGGSNFKNFAFGESENSNENSTKVFSYSNRNYIVADNDGQVNEGDEKFEYRKQVKKILGKKRVFDEHVEIENLIPFSIWKEVLPNLIKERSQIEIKESRLNENDFNKRIETEKIGVVLKDSLISKKKGKNPKYFEHDSIECLGVKKKDTMQAIIDYIDTNKEILTLKNFPVATQNLIKSIQKFIQECNQH